MRTFRLLQNTDLKPTLPQDVPAPAPDVAIQENLVLSIRSKGHETPAVRLALLCTQDDARYQCTQLFTGQHLIKRMLTLPEPTREFLMRLHDLTATLEGRIQTIERRFTERHCGNGHAQTASFGSALAKCRQHTLRTIERAQWEIVGNNATDAADLTALYEKTLVQCTNLIDVLLHTYIADEV